MVAQHQQQRVVGGVLAQIAAQHLEVVTDAADEGFSQFPAVQTAVQFHHVRGFGRREPVIEHAPVRVIRGNWGKRRMTDDGGKDHEQGRPVGGRHRGLVQPIQAELVGNGPPAIDGTAIVQASGVENLVEAIKPAFRPGILQPRFEGECPITGGGEAGDQGGAVAGQQGLVIGRVGDARARQQAGMRQPGTAAEGTGFHPRRSDPPAGGVQFLLQRGEVIGQGIGEVGIVEHQRAVGFEKNHQ